MTKRYDVLITGEAGMIAKGIIEKLPSQYRLLNPLLEQSTIKQFSSPFSSQRSEIDFADYDNINVLEHQIKSILSCRLVIIHCGAYVNTDKCETAPFDCVRSNVIGTYNMIELARRMRAFFIYFSTTAVNDPDAYMRDKGHFDENAIINPKTIYGLTKYAGELAVKQSGLEYLIIKPVFVYGNAPEDNSSMIRKIFTHIYRADRFGVASNLAVFLDPEHLKDYFRIEHFADMFRHLIDRDLEELAKRKTDFVLARGYAKKFQYYLNLIADIALCNGHLDQYITLYPEKDYLKDHCGQSNAFYKLFPEFSLSRDAHDDMLGLMKTWISVKLLYAR